MTRPSFEAPETEWQVPVRALLTRMGQVDVPLARPEADALADYERRRNDATLTDYHDNVAQAQFRPPPPEVLALRSELRGDQEATNRFYVAREGRLSM